MFIAHWIRLLPWRKARATCLAPRAADGASPDDDRPLGCGWFDSSHDLQQGLTVRPAEAPALEGLPLSDWLTLQEALSPLAETSLDAAQGMMRTVCGDQGFVDEESVAFVMAGVGTAGGFGGGDGPGSLRWWH